MVRIRKGCSYRKLERPYTRKSKFKKVNFVRMTPANLVVRYDMGDQKKKFEYTLNLITKDSLQIRHNAIESARQTSNRLLEKNLGKGEYFYRIKMYPHHHLRENKMATGAGADRMSTGMQLSFGKVVSIAARVKKGQTLAELSVNRENLDIARKALHRAVYKIPCSCTIQEVHNK